MENEPARDRWKKYILTHTIPSIHSANQLTPDLKPFQYSILTTEYIHLKCDIDFV